MIYCIYMSTHKHMHTYMPYVHMHECIHTHIPTYQCMHMHACIASCVHAYTYTQFGYIIIYTLILTEFGNGEEFPIYAVPQLVQSRI